MTVSVLFHFDSRNNASLDRVREMIQNAGVDAQVVEMWWESEPGFTGLAIAGDPRQVRDALGPHGWNLQWPRLNDESAHAGN